MSDFTRVDVDAIKSIPGRRWLPERQVWVLPHSRAVLDALGSLGFRFDVREAQAVRGAVPEAQAAGGDTRTVSPPEEVAAEAASDGTFRQGTFQHEAERILDAMRQEIRVREYSRKTELAYISWARRFLRFRAEVVPSPDLLSATHARAFLENLATDERLAARSRNQAASALSFMFREILGRDEMAGLARARGPGRMPVVLTHREVLRVLRELTGKYFLIVVLLYSAGLRVQECLRLRVKDIDFELRQILVRDGKGRKDRYVPLARRATALLRAQIRRVAELHEKDRARGDGWAPLPGALHRKDPSAGYELGWQWIFPAGARNTDFATGRSCRWPLHATAVQREVKHAVRRSGIPKRATCHTFRHSFATEALAGGCDIRKLQQVMGHKDIRTTTIYLHVVEQTGLHIRSPLDRPDDLEDDDLDPVGRPLARVDEHWDLANRQWDPHDDDRHPAGRRRRRTRRGGDPAARRRGSPGDRARPDASVSDRDQPET